MAAAEAIALVGFATKASTFVQQTASTWYKPSTDMRKFKQKSIDLRRRSKYWASLLRKYNMDDSEIGSLLEYASQLLDEEDIKIKALESSSWLRRMWTTLVFPEELTEAMENLCSAFEELPQRLAERGTTAQQLEKETFNQRAPLKFVSDKKYVELKVTMDAVQSALESETTGPVVTLCGGPGQGKTSMAIHLALVYQNRSIEEINPAISIREEELQTQNPASTMLSWGRFLPCCDWLGAFLSQDASSNEDVHATLRVESVPSAQNLVSNRFTDGVFFYSCGPTANSKDILVELWRDLGYQLLPPTTGAGQDESSIRKELIRRLANLKVLIVLDDVWEPAFIEKLLVHGRWIRYLVTTQKPQLWRDPNCVDILIENPTKEEAHKIVKNHVQGFPTDVTPDFEGAVDAFIEKSEQNPLVLVNMATSIRSQHASDLKEWESAGKYLEELVKDEDAQLATSLFGRLYSKRTMPASITMAVDSFSKQEQTLLVLASICEGQSIPEVVFQLFFKSIDGRLGWFSRCSENLENNNFIRIESKRVPWSKVPERSWSLHSMRQQVISVIRVKDVTSLIAKLLDCNPKDKIVVALLALYGQRQWHDEATRKLMNLKESCHNDEVGLASSHFSMIKPFVWLLQLEGEEEWEKKSYDLVEQVVHEYLLAGQLDDESLSLLLAMQQTIPPTIEALNKMASLKGTPILTKRHPRTAQALLNLLEYVGDGSEKVSSQSGWLLGSYSWDRLEDTIELQSFANVTERLVALLVDSVTPDAQRNAATALMGIFLWSELAHVQVTSLPDSIEISLLALLAEDVSPEVQGKATWALGSLSSKVPASAIKIALFPDAIPRLVALLGKDGSPFIQKGAAWTLGQLSRATLAEVSCKIAAFPRTMARLVALLAKGVSPDVQEYAAWAIGAIGSRALESSMQIASFPEAIERLSALLGKEGSPTVQKSAAWTLGQLSKATVAEVSCKIAAFPGTLARLVALLAEDVSPDVQQDAAKALANIGSGAVESAMQIASFPKAIERLSALLGKEGSPTIQKCAAWTLGQLVGARLAEVSRKIAAFPGTMARLVALLAKDVSPDVQKDAAWALGRIGSGAVESAMQIASFPEAIERLSALLGKEGSPTVQKWAAWTLGQLSKATLAEVSRKIAAFPSTMARLVALLAEDVSPDVQKDAAWALGRIGSGAVESAMQIASFPEAIERLSALLGKEGNPPVLKSAAWTLGQLSKATLAEVSSKIAAFPGTMARLVALLAEDVSPDVQQYAAWALGRIGSAAVESAMQIASFPEAIERLSALLGKEGSPTVQKWAAWTLGQLSCNARAEISCKIAAFPGTMARLVALLAKDVSPDVQQKAANALGNIGSSAVESAMQIASFPEAIERLSALLRKEDSPTIQKSAAWTLGRLSYHARAEISHKIEVQWQDWWHLLLRT